MRFYKNKHDLEGEGLSLYLMEVVGSISKLNCIFVDTISNLSCGTALLVRVSEGNVLKMRFRRHFHIISKGFTTRF